MLIPGRHPVAGRPYAGYPPGPTGTWHEISDFKRNPEADPGFDPAGAVRADISTFAVDGGDRRPPLRPGLRINQKLPDRLSWCGNGLG